MSRTTAPASGLMFDPAMQSFLVDEVLPGTGIGPDRFFDGLAEAVERFAPRNAELLARRDELQARLDRWYDEHAGPGDPVAYRAFLEDIGYLEPEPSPFTITTSDVDDEIASICGPQLVVPVTNPRYALNAANARWGSLYDALYGTDALGDPAPAGPYDPERGAGVVAWVRSLLDDVVPLDGASHADVTRYTVQAGRLVAWTDGDSRAGLADPEQLAGHIGSATSPTSVLLVNHGLHIELRFDPHHPVGATDRAGIADVIVEAAVTTIVDFEDSVACVDAEDKVVAYRNWLGLIRGDLTAHLEKGGRSVVRTLAPNRTFTTPRGEERALRGRSLLLARVVGHLMSTPAVHVASGPIPEGILDAFVVAAIAMHDRSRPDELRNSAHGSVYLVKPKMHGPAEVAYACEVFAAVEATLDLPPKTLKIGIMDEERRTTLNLEACIREAADRVVFINTGFLDRTGDEIHTSMRAGPVVRKQDMRSTRWIRAYEDANVDVGLRCGFAGRAQIGKGMWAAPDRMAALLQEKIGHPRAGANCAWVPSPTAAVLHATHYHRVDVKARQQRLAGARRSSIDDLLEIPVAGQTLTAEEVRLELDNNVQGILGYTVRWVDAGIGCSKVPDLDGVALMEDRATCRISSQHVANWLRHGVVSATDVEASLRRMAVVVDAQNAGDPAYNPMAPGFDGPAFRAARALVFEGERSPAGYTEPTLHRHRLERKRQLEGSPQR